MRAGRLRHRVELQSAAETRDTYGGVTKTWSTYDTVWASIEPLRGQEKILAQQVNASISHNIRMRYNDTVTVQHRILYDSRIFEINVPANTFEQNKETLLLCSEVLT